MRLLVLAPTQKDVALTRSAFEQQHVNVVGCQRMDLLQAELEKGAGAVLIAEEALSQQHMLVRWIENQPAWSDLPVLVLAKPNTDSGDLTAATQRLSNVTILVRPIRVAALVSAVHAALRARRRQYQIRRNLYDLAESEERLRLNDQRKDEFLAILAHELRNPLAPISSALHILRPWLAEQPRTASLGQMMERQLGNLTRLVDDLLEVSRVTRGELDLHRERVELASVIRTAIESSQPLIDSLHHRLDTVLPSQPIYLHADPVRLAQIVSNLLNNAAKYTARHGHIVLTVRPEDRRIAIEVQDNGMGIPPEAQARIFELFMQVDQNRNRSQGGLGIGLTLVKRLAELHGGSVDMASEGLGRGSCFTVRLPITEPALASVEPRPAGSNPDLERIHVLIADDNRDAADSLGLLLQHLGAEVTITYGGEQALDALATQRMDVAILDIGMPDVDGLQVARQIRVRADREKMLLIALTGWDQQQDIVETRAAGIDLHLTKPVDFDMLLNWLGRVAANRA